MGASVDQIIAESIRLVVTEDIVRHMDRVDSGGGGGVERDGGHIRSTYGVPRLLAQPSSRHISRSARCGRVSVDAATCRLTTGARSGQGPWHANSPRRSPRFTTTSSVLWTVIAVAVCRCASAQIPPGCRHALEESCPFATTNAADCETCASTSHGSKGRPVDTCGAKSVTVYVQ